MYIQHTQTRNRNTNLNCIVPRQTLLGLLIAQNNERFSIFIEGDVPRECTHLDYLCLGQWITRMIEDFAERFFLSTRCTVLNKRQSSYHWRMALNVARVLCHMTDGSVWHLIFFVGMLGVKLVRVNTLKKLDGNCTIQIGKIYFLLWLANIDQNNVAYIILDYKQFYDFFIKHKFIHTKKKFQCFKSFNFYCLDKYFLGCYTTPWFMFVM